MGWSDFIKEAFVGKGSYGKVYRVKRRSDGKIYALKEVNIKYMTHREREDAVNEIRLLASVNHPNIIAYFESFLENDKLCIVTEYCSNGDLFELLRRYRTRRRRLSEERIWAYFMQICYALRVLHNQNILHRDIKSPNVFLGENGRVKLGDLGVAKLMKSAMAHTQIGTPYYLSPEIWKSRPYNAKSDVWSLGCLLYEMTTLRHPFDATSQRALSLKIIKGKYAPIPREYSSDLADVIAACLQVNPHARPTLDELLEMPALLARLDLVAHHKDIDNAGSRGAVMNTIKVPRRVQNLSDLTEALPKPMYMQSSPAKLLRDAADPPRASSGPPAPSSSAPPANAQARVAVNPVIRGKFAAHADAPAPAPGPPRPLPALGRAARAQSEPADNKLAPPAPPQYVNNSHRGHRPAARFRAAAAAAAPPADAPARPPQPVRVKQYFANHHAYLYNKENGRAAGGPFNYNSAAPPPARTPAYPVSRQYHPSDQPRNHRYHHRPSHPPSRQAPPVVSDYRRRFYR